MIKMRKILTTLIALSMAVAMVFGTSITAYARGDQSQERRVPVTVTPGGVFIYGCYYEGNAASVLPVYTMDFPIEYLLAIDAAGITNEMSDYEKCVRINDYLCASVEYGVPETQPHIAVEADGGINIFDTGNYGLDLFWYGKGVCAGYADAFQTMTSMLGIESYVWCSGSLNHAWNAVVIEDVTYFVDVTWNDNEDYPNRYLMSTELWADHDVADIIIDGASPYGWEIRQEKEQLKMQRMEQLETEIINNMLNDEPDVSEIFTKEILLLQEMLNMSK